jgi:hypothetical protein
MMGIILLDLHLQTFQSPSCHQGLFSQGTWLAAPDAGSTFNAV